jgi:selenocysteine-specific elongation factor
VALASFAPTPTAEQQGQIERLLSELRAGATSARGIDRELSAYLVESGVLVDAGDSIVFEAPVFESMRSRIEAHLRAHGFISLAEARDLLGTNRRVAQALLEHLDRIRVTRRDGERRVLR